MIGLLVLIVLVVAAVAAWKLRVPLLAKILGQDQGRINRQINRRRD